MSLGQFQESSPMLLGQIGPRHSSLTHSSRRYTRCPFHTPIPTLPTLALIPFVPNRFQSPNLTPLPITGHPTPDTDPVLSWISNIVVNAAIGSYRTMPKSNMETLRLSFGKYHDSSHTHNTGSAKYLVTWTSNDLYVVIFYFLFFITFPSYNIEFTASSSRKSVYRRTKTRINEKTNEIS